MFNAGPEGFHSLTGQSSAVLIDNSTRDLVENKDYEI